MIGSQNRAVVSGGDDTDMSGAEAGESESGDGDTTVDPSEGNLITGAQTFTSEVSNCLAREAWHDAARSQHLLMFRLDTPNQNQHPLSQDVRRYFFLSLGNHIQEVAQRQTNPAMHERYTQYVGQLHNGFSIMGNGAAVCNDVHIWEWWQLPVT